VCVCVCLCVRVCVCVCVYIHRYYIYILYIYIYMYIYTQFTYTNTHTHTHLTLEGWRPHLLLVRGCHPRQRQWRIYQQPLHQLLSSPPRPSLPGCRHSPTLPERPPPPSPPWTARGRRACGQAREHFMRNHYLGAHAYSHWRKVHDTMAMLVETRKAKRARREQV